MEAVIESVTPTVQVVYETLPIGSLVDSGRNTRRRYDEARLEEMASSIRVFGILEPLIVRPSSDGRYEIVAGFRRYRGAQRAALEEVPCVVRHLSDVEALEVTLIENLQREDVHPLDEGEGYRSLQEADPIYTAKVIAAKIGKSTTYVYQKLKLLSLAPEAREAFEKDELTEAHAIRLARLTPAHQVRALEEACFFSLLRGAGADGTRRNELQPVAELDEWIEQHTKIDLSDEATLHYFPELAGELGAATDGAPAPALLELSASYTIHEAKGLGAVARGQWVELHGKKDKCPHVQRGVIVHGGPTRVIERVCATRSCPKHFAQAPVVLPMPGASKDAEETDKERRDRQNREAERVREEKRRAAWNELKPKAMQAIAEHLKVAPITADAVRHLIRRSWGDYRLKDLEKGFGPITDTNGFAAIAFLGIQSGTREEFLYSVKPFAFDLGAFEVGEKKTTVKTGKRPAPKAKAKKPRTKLAAAKKTAKKADRPRKKR